MAAEGLSVVVTTLNNAATLERCLASVGFADEIVLVDSGSNDDTLAIAQRHRARVLHKPFAGYGPQKTYAIDQASHRMVLLLDADEWLPEAAQSEIQTLLQRIASGASDCAGYSLPRCERLFWCYQHRWTRMNHFLRLFDRHRYRMSASTIHAAPEVDGPVAKLKAPFCHDGETSIDAKVSRISAYSTGLVADKLAAKVGFVRTRMLLYPPWFFLRLYFGKRMVLNGWAGFIHSAIGAFYVFLKYAKVYEARRRVD